VRGRELRDIWSSLLDLWLSLLDLLSLLNDTVVFGFWYGANSQYQFLQLPFTGSPNSPRPSIMS
jgi:hypothetical protein